MYYLSVRLLVWLLEYYVCDDVNGVFPKWNRNSLNSAISGNLINHRSMNWAQFKDPVSHMCLAGAVVASWSPTKEVAGWQVQTLLLQRQLFLSLNSANSVKTYRENSNDSGNIIVLVKLYSKIFIQIFHLNTTKNCIWYPYSLNLERLIVSVTSWHWSGLERKLCSVWSSKPHLILGEWFHIIYLMRWNIFTTRETSQIFDCF